MERLDIRTKSHVELRDITAEIRASIARTGINSGVAHVFVPHTTAGLTINENADPDVKSDMAEALERLVPWRQQFYQHNEGNSAAHIKASLMGFSATILIENGAPALGAWQGVCLCEFDGPRNRQVWVAAQPTLAAQPPSAGGATGDEPAPLLAQMRLTEVERAHILRVLEICGNNKKLAAERLGIDRSTLYAKLDAFGLPTQ